MTLAAMPWFRRKRDPISQREKDLADEIARLEAQIKDLGNQLQNPVVPPMPAGPAGPPPEAPRTMAGIPVQSAADEMVIEGSSRSAQTLGTEAPVTREHFNELGVRKYDLVALWDRIRFWFAGPTPANPKLIKMLAAGNIEGLRPLRIEKRKARRRFLVLATVVFLVLLGIISVFIRHG